MSWRVVLVILVTRVLRGWVLGRDGVLAVMVEGKWCR